jgi:hypothetical protein
MQTVIVFITQQDAGKKDSLYYLMLYKHATE